MSKNKPKTRAQRREDRRESIKQAAIEVFSEKGYHAAKVSEIVEQVGVAQGTFYLYYESKNQIFGELLQDFLSLVLTTIADWEPGAINTRQNLHDELVRVGVALTEVIVENNKLAAIFFKEALAVAPEFDLLIHEFYDALTALLTDTNRILCRRGLIQHMNFHLLALMTIGGVERIVYEYVVVQSVDDVDHREVVEHLVGHFLTGTSQPFPTVSEEAFEPDSSSQDEPGQE